MNKNAKKLLFGRSVSVLGDNLYRLAVIWYIYSTTQNSFYTGLATAVTMMPKVLSFLIGPLVDHGNKKKILVGAQLIQAMLTLIVPIAFHYNIAVLPAIFIVMFLVAFIENYQGTAEFAIIPHIIQENEFIKYNSLSSSVEKIVDILVSVAFAFVISKVSISQIYLLNGVTFFLAFLFFWGIRSNEKEQTEKLNFAQYKANFKEGLKAFFTSEAIGVCLPIMLINFIMGIVSAILPAYASYLGSIDYFGYISLAMSIGLVLGTTLAMKLTRFSYLTKIRFLPFITSVFWVVAILINNVWITLPLLTIAFIPYGILMIVMMTQIQSSLPMELLGRIVTIADSVLVVSMPLGAILGGTFAELIPPFFAMILGGLSILLLPLTTLGKSNSPTPNESESE